VTNTRIRDAALCVESIYVLQWLYIKPNERVPCIRMVDLQFAGLLIHRGDTASVVYMDDSLMQALAHPTTAGVMITTSTGQKKACDCAATAAAAAADASPNTFASSSSSSYSFLQQRGCHHRRPRPPAAADRQPLLLPRRLSGGRHTVRVGKYLLIS
jgi:hypothetical protein